MQNEKSVVSVIVNFHNGEKYLHKCLNSIVSQEYKNIEIILFDNFSNDKSKEIISSFVDKRIKYFYSNIKLTLYAARNQALKVSTGEFIAFLDSDDWWELNYLSSRKDFFNNQNFDYSYCNANVFYEKLNRSKLYRNYKLPNGKIFNHLVKDYLIAISGVIFRKKIFEKFGFFNEQYNIIGDYDFLFRIAKNSIAHSNNNPLLNYRVHNNNFSKLNVELFYEEYKDWFNNNEHNSNIKNKKIFQIKLEYLEITNLLLNRKRTLRILIKILQHKNLKNVVKFLILFFLPKKLYKFIKK
jgi:glycosyltransferase involved in cell wall biosynthesis